MLKLKRLTNKKLDKFNMKNYLTAGLFVSIGLFFQFTGQSLASVNGDTLGPGFFPDLISNILIIVGIIIALKQYIWKY